MRDGEAERLPRRRGGLELGGAAVGGRNAGVEARNLRDLAQIEVPSALNPEL